MEWKQQTGQAFYVVLLSVSDYYTERLRVVYRGIDDFVTKDGECWSG